MVAYVAYEPAIRHQAPHPCSIWCQEYSLSQVKLLYLLCVPQRLKHAYPPTNDKRTAISATLPATTKWGLPAQVIGSRIDVLPCKAGCDMKWEAVPVSIASYHPCSMRAEGVLVAVDLAAAAIQEGRDK